MESGGIGGQNRGPEPARIGQAVRIVPASLVASVVFILIGPSLRGQVSRGIVSLSIMIVTIDGPAGAGKSTVARALAKKLGFQFLDTGAMYRCVAYAAMQQKVPWSDDSALVELTRSLDIDVREDAVQLDGSEVTHVIRTMQVTSVIHFVADNPSIREELVQLQRRIGQSGSFVTEGRDQGTIVFPDAVCKIFLTASPKERAKRRQQELIARGEKLSFDEILARQNERDERDRRRVVGRLEAAADAFLVSSDHKSLDDVVDELYTLSLGRIAERQSNLGN